jgi:anti-anti-sigma regulatory factor
MNLILEVRTGREYVTLACHGQLIGGKEADAFLHTAKMLMGGFDNLIINLAGVRTVDCGGLGSLASVLGFAVDKSKRVRIVRASVLIMEMLHITRLDQFLDREDRPRPQLVATNHAAVA